MIINLKFLNGNTKEITVERDKTVKDIKVDFLKMDETKLDDVKIIYSGKILQNDQVLNNLALSDKSFFVVLTTTKATLDTISSNQNNDSASDSDEACEIDMCSGLFDCSDEDDDATEISITSKEEEEEEKIDMMEVIQKNNDKFLELIKDQNFQVLVDIIINKPEYLTYALKFVQSGMIFQKPNLTEEETEAQDFSNELEVLKSMDIESDEEKLKKVIALSSGDIQIAVRYLFLSKYDEGISI